MPLSEDEDNVLRKRPVISASVRRNTIVAIGLSAVCPTTTDVREGSVSGLTSSSVSNILNKQYTFIRTTFSLPSLLRQFSLLFKRA